MIRGNEKVLKDALAAGHSLGCHSHTHRWNFPFYSGRRIASEIRECTTLMRELTGREVRLFRPPFGVTNPRVSRGIRASGLTCVGWSRRSFDTRNENAAKVVRRITRKMGQGDIILLHESSAHILEILELLIPEIRKRGLECVSLDELLNLNTS